VELTEAGGDLPAQLVAGDDGGRLCDLQRIFAQRGRGDHDLFGLGFLGERDLTDKHRGHGDAQRMR
jgi:hypothetical protein